MLHALFVLDPTNTSELLGSPNTETSAQANSAETGDGAMSSQNNSLLSPSSSSSTMNEIFNRQPSNLSLVSQITTASQKSVESNVFGSDPFASDKNDDPFVNEDPFVSTSNQDDIFGEATPTKSDVFGTPTLVQGGTKQQNSDPVASTGVNESMSGSKDHGNLEGLFGSGVSSDTSNLAWGFGPASGAGDHSVNASSSNFGFGK